MTAGHTDHADGGTKPTAERLLVCVGPDPSAESLVHATGELASDTGAPWIAVHVETAREARLSEADRQRVAHTLHLAEQWGGETATLAGQNVADEIVAYARSRNITKIIVGKSQWPRWRHWLSVPVASQLIRKCDDIDVYVIRGEPESVQAILGAAPARAKLPYIGYLGALVVMALCTGLGFLMFPYFAPPNIIMMFLLGVVAVALRFGRGPSILASIVAVASFDFFFIPPFYTFDVEDKHYWVIFGVMLVTGLLISNLTAHLRFQVESARSRERRTAALYAMSRDLVHVTSITSVIEFAAAHIGEVFDAEIFMMLPDDIPLDLSRDCGTSRRLDSGRKSLGWRCRIPHFAAPTG